MRILVMLLIVLFGMLSFDFGVEDAQGGERPNIVYILADDMGYGDPRCFNPESKIPTPNIDRLANAGIRFTDAHTPSSVCTPTRYGVLTGRYPWRSRLPKGVLHGYGRLLIDPARMTVASLLKGNGYYTAAVGKWHLGMQKWMGPESDENRTDYTKSLSPGPNAVGFDYYYGIPASLDMAPYLWVENDKAIGELTETIGDSIPSDLRLYAGPYFRGGPITPDFKHRDVLPMMTAKAVEVIGAHAKRRYDKSLFLYFPMAAPHTPWMPTAPYAGKTEAGEYGDFVYQVDAMVGRVLDALEANGMAENTLVIFTSDNGAYWIEEEIEEYNHHANHYWRGQKADIWEGGHRVPFVARWPGVIPAGAVSDELMCHTDLLATCAAIVGAELPKDAGEDSFNMFPAMMGIKGLGGAPVREAVVHSSAAGYFAIRSGDWKLVTTRGSGGFSLPKSVEVKAGEAKGQLYRLDSDPSETRNLYLDEPGKVAELEALLERYQKAGRSTPTPE